MVFGRCQNSARTICSRMITVSSKPASQCTVYQAKFTPITGSRLVASSTIIIAAVSQWNSRSMPA